jgi:hypothetical protein
MGGRSRQLHAEQVNTVHVHGKCCSQMSNSKMPMYVCMYVCACFRIGRLAVSAAACLISVSRNGALSIAFSFSHHHSSFIQHTRFYSTPKTHVRLFG